MSCKGCKPTLACMSPLEKPANCYPSKLALNSEVSLTVSLPLQAQFPELLCEASMDSNIRQMQLQIYRFQCSRAGS